MPNETIVGLPQGGRLREPQPGVNPLQSLRSLMGLQSVSNVGNLSDRGLDVAAGIDQYEPDEQELKAAQMQTGGSVSREDIRKSAMGNVRQKLAERAQQQQRQDQLLAQQEESARQKQMLVNEGNANVARITGDSRVNQAESAANAKQAALDAMLKALGGGDRSMSVSGVGSVGAPPRNTGATAAQNVPEGMDKRLQDARSKTQGFHPLDFLQRKMGGTPAADTQYDAALTSVLTRMGVLEDLQGDASTLANTPGATLDERIAAAGGDASSLHPYEREWLSRKLGLGQ